NTAQYLQVQITNNTSFTISNIGFGNWGTYNSNGTVWSVGGWTSNFTHGTIVANCPATIALQGASLAPGATCKAAAWFTDNNAAGTFSGNLVLSGKLNNAAASTITTNIPFTATIQVPGAHPATFTVIGKELSRTVTTPGKRGIA